MTSKLVRHAPVVRTVVGADSHTGWLPAGATQPLPEQPRESIVDLRVLQRDGAYRLEWQAHDIAQWPLPSARGSQVCDSLLDAEAKAEQLFGVRRGDWSLVQDNGTLTATDVERLAAEVLASYGINDPAVEGWGTRVTPPRLVSFQLDSGERAELWLILDSLEVGSYVVFFDPETGNYGLGSRTRAGDLAYIADYGPLWTTLIGM